jgi:hypothetical protein
MISHYFYGIIEPMKQVFAVVFLLLTLFTLISQEANPAFGQSDLLSPEPRLQSLLSYVEAGKLQAALLNASVLQDEYASNPMYKVLYLRIFELSGQVVDYSSVMESLALDDPLEADLYALLAHFSTGQIYEVPVAPLPLEGLSPSDLEVLKFLRGTILLDEQSKF